MSNRDLTSAICTVASDRVVVRGHDLCSELIGGIGFTEYFFLLLTGERPSADQLFFLDAVLVSIAEHGMVPNVQAARMTLAAAPEALQAAVCAGLLGAGSVVLGSAEAAARVLSTLAAEVKSKAVPVDDAVNALIASYAKEGRRLPGFGHPVHKPVDPRAERLLALADARGTAGLHTTIVRSLARNADAHYGKHLVLNVSGVIPAVMLDVGFPAKAMKGIPILARSAALIAHLREEMEQPIGFALAELAEESVRYTGPSPSPTAPGTR
jgi:citrate synthase